MILSEDQYSYMTDYLKREYGYSSDWCKKVNAMSNEQIFAIFCRLVGREQQKRKPTRNRTIKRIEALKPKDEQISIFEWMNMKESMNV